MNLALYTRRSTDRQSASPHTQETLCRQYCEQNGHTIVRVYHEVAISGKTDIERRTALPELMTALKDRKTDRLCRNQAEWHRILAIFDKHNCALISVMDPVNRDTATGRLISSILADFAAYEREQTGERIYAHHLSAFLKGEWPGGPKSLGFDWDKEKKQFVLTDRAEDVIAIFKLYVSNNGNASATARDLNAMGIPSPKGQHWSNGPLLHMLRNPIYRQVMTYDGRQEKWPDTIPLLVPTETIAQVDTLLQWSRDQFVQFQSRPQAIPRTYSGILRCSMCGYVLTSNGSDMPSHRYYSGWLCGARRKHGATICDSHQVSTKHLDTAVGVALSRLLKELGEDVAKVSRTHKQNEPGKKTQHQRDRLIQTQSRTVDIYTNGYISESDFIGRMEEIKKKLAALEVEQQPAPAVSMDNVLAAREFIGTQWGDILPAEKRALLLQIGASYIVNTTGEEPWWIELRTNLLPRAIRVQASCRGRWGLKKVSCCVL